MTNERKGFLLGTSCIIALLSVIMVPMMSRADRLKGQKEWRDANKDKIATGMKEWRANNKAAVAEYAKLYRQSNPNYQAWKKDYDKHYYEQITKNSEEQLARRRETGAVYVKAYPEKHKEHTDRYRKSHRTEIAAKAKAAYQSKSADERKALRLARAEYDRQWREDHKLELQEAGKQYRRENSELRAAWFKAHYAANRERVRERVKARYGNMSDAEKQKEFARAAAWNKAHPEARAEVVAVSSHIRRTRITGAGGEYTAEDIAALREKQQGKCAGLNDARCLASTQAAPLTVDHVMPVYLGGSSDPSNLQLLCKSCNSRKSRMHPDAWAARLGKLVA